MKLSNNIKSFLKGETLCFPGMYPLTLIMGDGGLLCGKCALENKRLILQAHATSKIYGKHDRWFPKNVDVFWEGDIRCDYCSENVTAYGEI